MVPLIKRGRSPRVRRNPVLKAAPILGAGSISARAEEPHCLRTFLSAARVDLRACGGTIKIFQKSAPRWGRSPRVRRNPVASKKSSIGVGSISARAEEPGALACSLISLPVDLRACGGTASTPPASSGRWGRSPRVRRNLTSNVLELLHLSKSDGH